ncbi:MAG TPA: hypothetical protein VLT32_10650 [Candidatus Sulfomarinibacteraceae bacterium]|nr:hypothetical protein [Candidatus Sulfomarinibacteraceae bacterium]
MWHHHLIRSFAIITVAVSVAVLLPGCRRQSEQPPAETPAEPSPTGPPVETIDLPQSNPEIGVTLDRAPSGLAVTYNGEYWIELADLSSPGLRYVFVPVVENNPAISPESVADFESMVKEYPDGQVGPRGELDTRFGLAKWSSGTYSEDGELLLDVRLFVPHPSGSGAFVLYSSSREDLATVEQRLETMRGLLDGIS